jgi:ketosteroid isomerase-like protein
MNPIDVARRHDQAFNLPDTDALKKLQSPDIETILPGGISLRGPDHIAGYLDTFWAAFGDARLEESSSAATSDTVVTEGVLTGTHTGNLPTPDGPLSATGKAVRVRYASVERVHDGRVASEHLYFDQLELLDQLRA